MFEHNLESKLPPPHSLGLGVQLLSILCVIALCVAVSAAVYFAGSERSYITALMDNEREQKLELLVAATLDDLISEDVPQIETSMGQLIKRDPDIKWLNLENESGKILFRYPRNSTATTTNNSNFRIFKKDIMFERERFGVFTVVWDTEPFVKEVRARAYKVGLFIGVVCLFLGALFFIFIKIFIISPVQKISDEVKDIRNGNYDEKDLPKLNSFVATEIHNMDSSVGDLRHHLIRREHYELELKKATLAAEQANHAKSQFLANVSHELRTPLNAIIGFAEMIKLELFGKIAEQRYVEYSWDIYSAGNHLLDLINDILDLSRIEAGKIDLNYSSVDITEAVRSGVVLIQPMLSEKNIFLNVTISDDLPHVIADRQRVQQILINLLSNAVKFTCEGGQVSVTARPDEQGNIAITVADTGVGIAADDLERIFRPFEQVANAFTRQHTGSGLGLPITKALIESHGGTMDIQSKTGEGTELTFTLPADLELTQTDDSKTVGDTDCDNIPRLIA